MRIAILGCGAMGTVLGAYLARNGCPVDLIDSNQAHVEALNQKGAHVVGAVDVTVPVHACTPNEMQGIYDLVFLLTKQTANDVVLPGLLPHLGVGSTVCTLQNGVPEPYVAGYVGQERTVGGTVLWGATFVGAGQSELTQDITKNDHLFEVGEIDGSVGPRIQTVAEVLGHMGRPTKVTDSLMASRWGKLINNACMSGMSAVCGATFGEVLQSDHARACLSHLGREVKRCCEGEGHQLPMLLNEQSPATLDLRDQAMFDADQRMFLTMYADMHPAKASMLQDLEKGQKSEVGMINGFVSQTGAQLGIDTPFNDMVVEIVTRIEKGELPLSMDNLRYFDPALFVYQEKSVKELMA